MTLQSINGRIIYWLIYNPLKQIGKMDKRNTCKGCTAYGMEYDKLERRYNHYCWLFGCWQDEAKPNAICKYHLRNKSDEQN